MENLIPQYKLRSGKLTFEDQFEIQFNFGLVYEDEGLFFFELFFDKELPLEKIHHDYINIFQEKYLTLESITEENNILKSSRICLKSFPFNKSKGDFYCFGHIYIEKVNEIDDLEIKDESLFFLKLEGLELEFTSRTQVKKWRDNKELSINEGVDNFPLDHSLCIIKIEFDEYKTLWLRDDDNNIIVEFTRGDDQYQTMKFEVYKKIKHDFIEFISFLNGAQVQIHTEYTGQYSIHPHRDSHKKNIYSYKKEKHRSYNDFIPMNSKWFLNYEILNRAFKHNFKNYIKVNRANSYFFNI